MDRTWEFINRSQTTNVEIGAEAIPRKGVHKWDFRCSVGLKGSCTNCIGTNCIGNKLYRHKLYRHNLQGWAKLV